MTAASRHRSCVVPPSRITGALDTDIFEFRGCMSGVSPHRFVRHCTYRLELDDRACRIQSIELPIHGFEVALFGSLGGCSISEFGLLRDANAILQAYREYIAKLLPLPSPLGQAVVPEVRQTRILIVLKRRLQSHSSLNRLGYGHTLEPTHTTAFLSALTRHNNRIMTLLYGLFYLKSGPGILVFEY